MAQALRGTGDPQELLAGLVDGVARALPAAEADGVLDVDRDRTLGDRLAGRPGRIAAVRLTGPDAVLSVRSEGRRLTGEAATVVRGVTISRRTLPLGEWLAAFAGQVAAVAAESAGDAAAASTALRALGVAPSGGDLGVDASDVAGGLATLPARVAGRVPDEAVATVARTVELLRDTLPRVSGDVLAEVAVQRTATAYLPDTLRSYVALPPDWARTHVLPDGSTAATALLAQLTALETAARAMRDAALSQDASALLANGRFLADRFATSSLDLPD